MADLTRRRVLQATAGITTVSLGGCASRPGQAGDQNDGPTCSATPSNGRPSASVYISEINANPEGFDEEKLNEETVLIEVTRDGAADLSGHSLVYCGRHTYEFPDDTSDVDPGATLVVHSGDGDFGVDASAPPQYNLYVGESESVLANDGMQLSLRTPDDEVLDTVRYSTLDPGERYIRPE